MQSNPVFLAITLIGVILTFTVGSLNLYYTTRNSKKSSYVNAVTSERVEWIGKLRELISEFISLVSLHEAKYIAKAGKERGEYLDKVVEYQTKIGLFLNYKDDRDKEIIGIVNKITQRTFEIYDIMTLIEMPQEKRWPHFVELESTKSRMRTFIEQNPVKFEGKSVNEIYKILHDELAVTREQFNDEFRKKPRKIRNDIKNESKRLIYEIQVYLKDEWERVKNEAEHGNPRWLTTKKIHEITKLSDLPRWESFQWFTNKVNVVWKLFLIILMMVVVAVLVVA